MGNEEPKSYEQDLVKYRCYDCMEEFIVGQRTVERTNTLRCPFCGQTNHLDDISSCEGEDHEELELGCFGIGYEEDNQGNRVVDRLKALERALFMEKDRLMEERKKELNDYYVCEGKEFYRIEEFKWASSKL